MTISAHAARDTAWGMVRQAAMGQEPGLRSTHSGMLRRKRGAPWPRGTGWAGGLALAADRTLGEATVLEQAIVQHQRADHRQIERESGGNLHDVPAALQHGGRQAGPLGSQHVGGVHRMTERRKVRGVVQQLHSHQHAMLRQAKRLDVRKAPERHVLRCRGGVGESAGARIEAGADDEAERSVEGVRGAQQGADIGRFRDALDADAEIAA